MRGEKPCAQQIRYITDGELVWNTFLGGASDDTGWDIAVLGLDVYITGQSNAGWGTPKDPYSDGGDAFAAGLDYMSGALKWHTFLGGSALDHGNDLAVDNQGNIYITGGSSGTWGSPLREFVGVDDAFIAKISSTGGFIGHTFLGGSSSDAGTGIAVDSRRNIYIGGGSTASWGTPLNPFGSSSVDGFVARHTSIAPTRLNDFRSQAALDGWVLESSETSGRGGTMSATAAILALGDDAADRQYRSILSFDTSGLPDKAVITKVTLQIKKWDIKGENPFFSHGGLKVDIRTLYFSTSPALEISDFQAVASKLAVGMFKWSPTDGWYSAVLTEAAFPYVNRTGRTQFRLRFAKDDDDLSTDTITFHSGNSMYESYRPLLLVEFYAP